MISQEVSKTDFENKKIKKKDSIMEQSEKMAIKEMKFSKELFGNNKPIKF